jgi:bifunctional DNA-binding transcriptional regulator/antitoxin component of YhaV-PrlF toxin-antitoxin module
MESVILSAKYQLVVPQKLRQKLHLQPGQKVHLSFVDETKFIVNIAPRASKLFGSIRGAWGKDSDTFLKTQRQEANRDSI